MVGLLVALLAAMEIHAAGACPTGAEVERALGPLLGAGPEAHTSDVATIRHGADGALLVALADAGGATIEERRLPPAGACHEQAETAAVTLAIWEAQLHPEISLRLDRLSAGAPPPTISAAPVTSPVPARTFALGVALAGDRQSGALAPAGRVELAVGRGDGRPRARLAVVGVGRHALDVAPGRASWWRAFVALGGEIALARGTRGSVTLGAAVATGLAAIAGEGFAVDRGARSLELGGEASLRAVVVAGRLRPWLGLSAVGWLRRQVLELQGGATTAALPRVEPMAALGADFLW
jgi:hypothetical protein